jgi:hypothetical protein
MLTPRQEKMLTGEFYIDGWHNRHCLGDANLLVEKGLLDVREGGDDQYTSYHYTPTGKAPD